MPLAGSVPEGGTRPRAVEEVLAVDVLEVVLFSTPFFPLRGGVYPSPYPLPLGLERGVVAGRWSVCFAQKWRQDGPRELKMTSKIAQDSPR